MELKINETELGDLKQRANEFLKYERFFHINAVLCFIWFFFPLAIGQALRPLTVTEIEILLLVGLVPFITSVVYPFRKMKDFKVKDIEWLKLYSCGIHNNLADYFGTDSKGVKKKSKQNAWNYAQSLWYAVQQRWEVGSFSLVEGYQKAVSDFEKNLKYRVMPALESNDDKKLGRVRDLMYQFFAKSNKITLPQLAAFNEDMSTKDGPKFLDSTEPEKISYHTVIGWVKDKRIQPYLVPLGFSFVVSLVFFIILIQWFAIDMLLITVVVMLFGILSTILIQIKKKQGD